MTDSICSRVVPLSRGRPFEPGQRRCVRPASDFLQFFRSGVAARVPVRRLDWWLNILIYIGRILAGAKMMAHVEAFNSFEEFGNFYFTSIPAYAETNQRYMTWAIVGVGVPFLAYYVFSYMRLAQRGYEVSSQKVALLVSTGIVTIWAWGFNAFGEAFFIVNFFHALQYFAIVWWSEKKNMCRAFGFESRPTAMRDTLIVLIAVGTGYGALALYAKAADAAFLVRVLLVVSIMHFWYDGFIWSVRKKQVSAA